MRSAAGISSARNYNREGSYDWSQKRKKKLDTSKVARSCSSMQFAHHLRPMPTTASYSPSSSSPSFSFPTPTYFHSFIYIIIYLSVTLSRHPLSKSISLINLLSFTHQFHNNHNAWQNSSRMRNLRCRSCRPKPDDRFQKPPSQYHSWSVRRPDMGRR